MDRLGVLVFPDLAVPYWFVVWVDRRCAPGFWCFWDCNIKSLSCSRELRKPVSFRSSWRPGEDLCPVYLFSAVCFEYNTNISTAFIFFPLSVALDTACNQFCVGLDKKECGFQTARHQQSQDTPCQGCLNLEEGRDSLYFSPLAYPVNIFENYELFCIFAVGLFFGELL